MITNFFFRSLIGAIVGLALFVGGVLIIFTASADSFTRGCLLLVGGSLFGVFIVFFTIGYGLSRCSDGFWGWLWIFLGLLPCLSPLGLFILGGVAISYTLGFLLTIWTVPWEKSEVIRSVNESQDNLYHEALTPEQLAVKNYIISSRQQGVEDNEIITHLQQAGWSKEYVTQALALRRK